MATSKKSNFENRNIPYGLTFDDVLVVPGESNVLPRDVDLHTRLTKKLPLNVPLVSAAMDTVTEYRTAIAMAREGGIGIIHKNMPIEEQVREVAKVKKAEYWIIKEPITVDPDDKLETILMLKEVRRISSFPVVKDHKLAGIITNRDLLFEKDLNKKAKDIMTKDLVTVDHFVSMNEAKKILHENRIEKLPVIDKKGILRGLITITDIESRERYPNTNKDKEGRLVVGAAVGPSLKDRARIEKLIEAEVDVIVVDTAHGHSKMVVDATRDIKKKYGSKVQVIAGNIATKEAAHALVSAGADAVKVGIGPGAICTTRIIAGVGVPQLTAIMDVASVASKYNVPVIADGGVRYSGDIVKALVAGADSVMIGSLFAGCEETPGKTTFMYNRKFKQYRGMGSLGAMTKGSAERYFQSSETEKNKLVPEGIEGVVPYRGTISEIVYQLCGGVRSGMGYAGARNILELKKAKLIRITNAGVQESHPHNIIITDEAPNYSGNLKL